MRLGAWIFLFLASLALSACRGSAHDSDPPAVCTLPLPKHLQHTSPDKLPASVWYQLLFKGHPSSLAPGATARVDDALSADPVDCSGEPIVWEPLPSSCLEHEPPSSERQRRRQLGPDGLIIRHAGGDYWFGWAPFVAFDNGMSEGPLAITRVQHGELEVRAIGNLRAYTKRVGLEVRKLGGQHILVAEGEWCGARQTCARGTRLLWLDRQRFRERPLRSATLRSCLGPAWFPHVDVVETQLDGRWRRKLRRDVALAYQDKLIMVAEHITVNDHDSAQPSLPPRLFREAQAQIRVTLEGGELLSEGQSLWRAIRLEDGSTELHDVARASP